VKYPELTLLPKLNDERKTKEKNRLCQKVDKINFKMTIEATL
jgi:hypothetical protein